MFLFACTLINNNLINKLNENACTCTYALAYTRPGGIFKMSIQIFVRLQIIYLSVWILSYLVK